jgi:hypothetical protein
VNIINEHPENIVLFKDLSVGDVFHVYGDYYVRIKTHYNVYGIERNSLNLTNYDFYSYWDEQPVTKVEADLHVK